jgi:hypothetical protein
VTIPGGIPHLLPGVGCKCKPEMLEVTPIVSRKPMYIPGVIHCTCTTPGSKEPIMINSLRAYIVQYSRDLCDWRLKDTAKEREGDWIPVLVFFSSSPEKAQKVFNRIMGADSGDLVDILEVPSLPTPQPK